MKVGKNTPFFTNFTFCIISLFIFDNNNRTNKFQIICQGKLNGSIIIIVIIVVVTKNLLHPFSIIEAAQ